MVERWTQERRRARTRDLLLDAAEDVFARRGFEGASLEEIADAAGYTRGAIYKHFGGKTELFLAVNQRVNERFLGELLGKVDLTAPLGELDLPTIAKQWRQMELRDDRAQVLALEFNLYVLRHPEVREAVAAHRRAVAEILARFIDEQSTGQGVKPPLPSLTLARMLLAASAGLEMAEYLDGSEGDLYEPFLQLLVRAWEDGATPARSGRRSAAPSPKGGRRARP